MDYGDFREFPVLPGVLRAHVRTTKAPIRASSGWQQPPKQPPFCRYLFALRIGGNPKLVNGVALLPEAFPIEVDRTRSRPPFVSLRLDPDRNPIPARSTKILITPRGNARKVATTSVSGVADRRRNRSPFALDRKNSKAAWGCLRGRPNGRSASSCGPSPRQITRRIAQFDPPVLVLPVPLDPTETTNAVHCGLLTMVVDRENHIAVKAAEPRNQLPSQPEGNSFRFPADEKPWLLDPIPDLSPEPSNRHQDEPAEDLLHVRKPIRRSITNLICQASDTSWSNSRQSPRATSIRQEIGPACHLSTMGSPENPGGVSASSDPGAVEGGCSGAERGLITIQRRTRE